jgi:hypothetical protein
LVQSIRDIFEQNIRLLGDMEKAVCYFREQQCDKAMELMADSIDGVKICIEAIISNRDYFNVVNTESMLEMLTGILEAKKNGDYILLADLLELQLINFLIGVQELIISKEEIDFDEQNYRDNIELLLSHSEGLEDKLKEPVNTTKLVEAGYRIEFTSCGLMTLAAENGGSKFYFHTNNKVRLEAFQLARHWYRESTDSYLIYGFGMGYHISELLALTPEAQITIFEADVNVLQLACAFTDLKSVFRSSKVRLCYDPDLTKLKEYLSKPIEEGALKVHYPSFMNVRGPEGRELLSCAIPWLETVSP